MAWLFSKNNSFAHEDPATINALMSASVEGKSPTTAPQIVFDPSPSGSPPSSVAAQLPTNSKEFFVIDVTNQFVTFVRRIAGPQYIYVIQMFSLDPQLSSEAPAYSHPLLSSWTFLSHPPHCPLLPFLETRQ